MHVQHFMAFLCLQLFFIPYTDANTTRSDKEMEDLSQHSDEEDRYSPSDEEELWLLDTNETEDEFVALMNMTEHNPPLISDPREGARAPIPPFRAGPPPGLIRPNAQYPATPHP